MGKRGFDRNGKRCWTCMFLLYVHIWQTCITKHSRQPSAPGAGYILQYVSIKYNWENMGKKRKVSHRQKKDEDVQIANKWKRIELPEKSPFSSLIVLEICMSRKMDDE